MSHRSSSSSGLSWFNLMQIFTGNKEELFSKVTFHEPKQQVTVHRCTLFLAHGTNTARAEGIFELPLPRPCYCSGRTAADAGPSCKLGEVATPRYGPGVRHYAGRSLRGGVRWRTGSAASMHDSRGCAITRVTRRGRCIQTRRPFAALSSPYSGIDFAGPFSI